MIKKERAPHSTVYLRPDEKRMFKRLVYSPPDLSPRFTCKLVEHRKSGLTFHFGLPFRQKNGTSKLPATEDYGVFHISGLSNYP